MLVLTQLSVGTVLAELVLKEFASLSISGHLSLTHRWVALATGLLALGVSVLHLGRPLYAFRAVLGFKTSWLSREIAAFGLFAFLAVLYACQINALNNMNYVVFLSGLIGVLCSVMVYRDTQRPFWDNNMTTANF
jgi:DMSO reductase anchor subunit